MPLKSGYGKRTISKNIAELMRTKPSKVRKKGIKTLAKRRGLSENEAERVQASAIAFAKAKRSKRR